MHNHLSILLDKWFKDSLLSYVISTKLAPPKKKKKIHINFWSVGQANSLGFWASLVGQVHTH